MIEHRFDKVRSCAGFFKNDISWGGVEYIILYNTCKP
jgi:hypothetical protein